jgi:hypothetical protein
VTALDYTKTFSRPLVILAAGLMLQAHSAFAGDPTGDAQAQARDLLNRPVAHHVIAVETSANSRANDRSTARADAQESARALLSGRSFGTARSATVRVQEGAPSASAQDRHSYGDPQDAARRMILGATPSSRSQSPQRG